MDYKNINDLWYNTLFNIGICGHKLDSRVGDSKEIIGFQVVLKHPINNILFIPQRKFSLSYACAEMLWYLSGTKNIEMMKAYAPQYENFAEFGEAYGAYGSRWKEAPGFMQEKKTLMRTIVMHGEGDNTDFNMMQNQLYALIHLLKTKPNTRQAIMTMWNSGDLVHAILGDRKDLPCTLSLIFFVRNHKLHLVTTMRSNDAWLGLPYDIFCFTTLQRIIALELELELGTYIHQAGSEHIYLKNQEKVDQILRTDAPLYPNPVGWKYVWPKYGVKQNIEQALIMEKEIRKIMITGSAYGASKETLTGGLEAFTFSKETFKIKRWNMVDPLFKDLVLGCATKWVNIPEEWFSNPLYANWQRCAKVEDENSKKKIDYVCNDCGYVFGKPQYGKREDGLLLNGCPKCGFASFSQVKEF